jgi:predicted NBD/HSP70 family sugar kinase
MASLKHMRSSNRIRLLQALRLAGEADREALVRMTGLSRATVSSLVGEAIACGHVVEERPGAATPAGRGGRRGMLRVDPRGGVVAGVALGHRHLRVLLADLQAVEVGERRVELDIDAAPGPALGTAAELVGELLDSAGVDAGRLLGVGLGVAGPLDRGPGATGPASAPDRWTGVAPEAELSRRLGVPVRVENDANLGMLGEHFRGAAQGARNAVYVKLSSGVGAGLLLDGDLYVGSRGTAGELGHVTVEPNGSICRCGSRGCLETVASTAALARAVAPAHGNALAVPELLGLGERDPVIAASLREIGGHTGRALSPLCMALDIDLVVLGGELGRARGVVGAVRGELARVAVARAPLTVRPGVLGPRAELIGAVALALGREDWLVEAGLIGLDGIRTGGGPASVGGP